MANTITTFVAQLSGLRVRTLINRRDCANDIARHAHTRLARVLAEMVVDLCKISTAERDYAKACRSGDGEDEGYELAYCRERFAETWQEEPIALLDDAWVDRSTGEYFDREADRWFFCDGVLPIIVPVDADMLCGLKTIIAEIEDVSGTSFTIEHVCYSEMAAETAFHAHRANVLESA